MRAVLLALCAIAMLTSLLPSAKVAAATSASLDQCANGSATNPDPTACESNNEWVNGNLGASKAHYAEGESIPYRLRMTDVPTTRDVDLIIEWDTTKQGKHAIDYLTTFDHTIKNARPCLPLNVSPCNTTPSKSAIPADPQVTLPPASVQQDAGVFTLWGGTIEGVSGYRYPLGTGFAGDKSAQITIRLRATVANPVFAWGGHIASRADWGPGSSASAISGSPYHMRLISIDGKGGNQDRSLATAAIVSPARIQIVKETVPGGDPTDFTFTADNGLTPATFVLDDDPSSDPPSDVQGYTVSVPSKTTNTYTVTETAATGWTPTVTCVEDGSQDSTKNGGSIATIKLQAGEFVECAFTNTRRPGKLTVIKHVVNDDGGTASAGDFTMSVNGNKQPPPTFPGHERGTVVDLDPGVYQVGETGPAGYARTDTGDCNSTIAAGEAKTCTVTNDDTDLTVSVTKEASPSSVPEPGGDVKFTVTVQNVSDEVLTITNIEDSAFNDVTGNDNCQVGTVLQPGGSCSFEYTRPVTGNAGTTHTNTVIVTLRSNDGRDTNGQGSATVTITGAAPTISVDKSGPDTIEEPGGNVTYAVRVTNTSAATDPVEITSLQDDPGGVQLTGDDDCSVGRVLAPGESCEFEFVGSVTGPAGTSHTDTVTVTVTDDEGAPGQDDDSHTVTIVCTFVPGDAAGATTSGNAYAARIVVPLLGINTTLPGPIATSSQSGVGNPPANESAVINQAVIPGIVALKLLSASSDAGIAPTIASDRSESTVAKVDLLAGTVVAEAVTASATASATGAGGSVDSFDSTIANLTVLGQPVANIKPGAVVKVKGVGNLYVYDRKTSVVPGNPNAADISVDMLRLDVTLDPVLKGTSITISHAEAHARFPANKVCGAPARGSVSGDAAIATLRLNPDVAEVDVVTAGPLPASGGFDLAQVAHVGPLFASPTTKVLEAQAATSKTGGAFDGSRSAAQSQAEVASAHVLKMGLDPALLFAQAVESHSSSVADAGGASSEGSTTLVNVTVAGTNVCEELGLGSICTPEPNTDILEGGPVLIRLNEQLEETTGNATAITVNAIHIFILGENNPFGLPVGADIVIGRSHSDACFDDPAVVGGC